MAHDNTEIDREYRRRGLTGILSIVVDKAMAAAVGIMISMEEEVADMGMFSFEVF